MNWVNIFEGALGSLIATVVSAIVTVLYARFVSPRFKEGSGQENLRQSYKDPFSIFLFLTVFLSVLSFFSLVYDWVLFNFVYLLLATIVVGVISALIFKNQCPKCKHIFSRKLVNKVTMHQEERPYRYRDCTIYLYTDGSEKDRKYGKELVRMETWRLEKLFFKCYDCSHEWDEVEEKNLDKNSRPEPNTIRTNKRPPSQF